MLTKKKLKSEIETLKSDMMVLKDITQKQDQVIKGLCYKIKGLEFVAKYSKEYIGIVAKNNISRVKLNALALQLKETELNITFVDFSMNYKEFKCFIENDEFEIKWKTNKNFIEIYQVIEGEDVLYKVYRVNRQTGTVDEYSPISYEKFNKKEVKQNGTKK